MSRSHGKKTVLKVAASDISNYTNASELTRTSDSHDVTTYGNDAHRKDGGLLDGGFKASGFYDNTAVSGPSALLRPLLGTITAIIRQTEGTGTTKPQDSFDALLTSYVESNPVADMVTWSAEWEIDGDVDITPQA